jgi:hypothetical protein
MVLIGGGYIGLDRFGVPVSGSVHRRTFRTGVANAVQDLGDLSCGGVRRDAPRRGVSRHVERPFARVRIRAILHLTMFFALADGAGLLQHGNRPATKSPDCRSACPGHQLRAHSCQDESLRPSTRSARLARGRDSETG